MALPTDTSSGSWLIFRIGRVGCAVPALSVDTILMPPPHLTAVPGTDGGTPGMFHHGSETVTAIDLRHRFGHSAPDLQRGRLLLSHIGNRAYGFWVDRVDELIEPERAAATPLPPELPHNLFVGALLHQGGIVLCSEPSRLLAMADAGVLRQMAWPELTEPPADIAPSPPTATSAAMAAVKAPPAAVPVPPAAEPAPPPRPPAPAQTPELPRPPARPVAPRPAPPPLTRPVEPPPRPQPTPPVAPRPARHAPPEPAAAPLREPAPIPAAEPPQRPAPRWPWAAAALVAAALVLGWFALRPPPQAPTPTPVAAVAPAPAPAPKSPAISVERNGHDITITIDRAASTPPGPAPAPAATAEQSAPAESPVAAAATPAPTEPATATEAAPAAPPPPQEQVFVHVVVKGDTLWAIAKRYLDDPWRYHDLARASGIDNPDLIYPGDRVHIVIR